MAKSSMAKSSMAKSSRTQSRKIFAVHPGEILKTEFMEPMGVTAYELVKALDFPGIYEVVRGDRAISAETTIRLGKYFALPAQFWLNLQNDYDLRMAEVSGIGKGIKPRKTTIDTEPAEARI
jgi:addiction module HigA family antidote